MSPEPQAKPGTIRIWKFARDYLLRHKPLIFVTVLLVPALSALNLLQPYLIKVAIDSHILKNDLHGLRTVALIYLGLVAAEYGLNFVQIYLMQLSGQKIVFDLRKDLFRKLHELDSSYYQKTPVGVTLTRLTGDCEVIVELFSSGIVSLVWDVLRLSAIVVAMSLLDWRLTAIAFSVVPVLIILVLFFRRRLRESYDLVREKVALLNAFVQEMTNGMAIVQMFRQERHCFERFCVINDAYKDANLAAVRHDAWLYALVEGLASIAIGLMIWFGGGSLVQGAVSIGVLIAFIEYVQRFFGPIRDLSSKVAIIQSARVALSRLVQFLDQPAEIRSPRTPAPFKTFSHSLDLRDVSFAYDEGKPVLSDLSLALSKGTRVAVIGVTGSGKSTLFKLLNRTYEVDQGEILLDGTNIKDLELDCLRSIVGVVSQDVFLFSGSVADNIRMFDGRFSEAEILNAAKAVGAHTMISRLPQNYDFPVAPRGANLSMGQRQLIALARVALFNPPILLLDEATAHIDPATTRLLQKGIEEISKSRTVLVAAHRLETIKHTDMIVVLHHGRLREQGTYQELLKQGGLFSRLYRTETVLA